MKRKLLYLTIFFGILALGAIFRLYGNNWDQNAHLHPDERFLTMVGNAISWPTSFSEYIDPAVSPLNPYNKGYDFFVYGRFPLILVKYIADSFGQGDYNHLNLVGRFVSGLFDLGTVVLVFLIAKLINSKLGSMSLRAKRSNPNRQTENVRDRHATIKSGLAMTYSSSLDFGFRIFPLLAMFFYSIMVLPIQQSHFFTVDTFLTFFITFTFYFLIKLVLSSKFPASPAGRSVLSSLFIGVSFGLALASKISAILFLPIIEISFIVASNTRSGLLRRFTPRSDKMHIFNSLFLFLIFNLLFLIFSYFTFRLADPYAFYDNDLTNPMLSTRFIENLKSLKQYDTPGIWFPPGVQWITTKPIAFPFKNIIYWGLGLPMGIIGVISVIFMVIWLYGYMVKWLKNKFSHPTIKLSDHQAIIFMLITIWILYLFFYQGIQYVKALRYFYQIYPFIALVTGWFICYKFPPIIQKLTLRLRLGKEIKNSLTFNFLPALLPFAFCLLILVYPLSYLSIYTRPTTRVAASDWIYQNIPQGKTVTNEYWDDPLPIYTEQGNPGVYHGLMLPLYDPDNSQKWQDVTQKLEKADYIFLSSNRLYGSITTVPDKYPVTNNYYQKLFKGNLGFTKVAQFTSRPRLPIPGVKLCLTPPFSRYAIIVKPLQECSEEGISFVDDYADESFTVYDHPKVIIFQKTHHFSAPELYKIISE